MAALVPSSAAEPSQPHVGALAQARNVTRIHGLDAQLEELRRRYHGREDLPGIQLLLKVLGLLCEAAKDKLIADGRDIPARFALPNEAEFGDKDVPLSEELWPVTNALDELEIELEAWRDLIEVPQGSTFDAIAEPFTHLTKELPHGANVELIFRPVPVRRYQVYFDVLPKLTATATNIRPSLGAVFSSMPRLMAVEYPASFESDTLMHAALAHEVAHIALVVGQWEEEIWTKALVERGLGDEEAVNQRKVWEELACDFLAVNLIGPAYALAFLEYSFAANLWKRPHSADYPDLAWRVERLKKAVEPFLGGSAENDELAQAGAIVSQWLDLVPSQAETGKEAVLAALQDVESRVGDILGEARYKPADFRAELPVVCRKLDKRIAPAEVIFDRDLAREAEDSEAWSRPIDWRAIINGGYVDYLAEYPTSASALHREQAEEGRQARERMCRLVQGSIELSQLHRNMRDQRQQLAGLEMT